MQAEQTAHRVLFLIRNVGSPAHLPCKLLQHHRQLPELYHDRIPAFQESVLPFQIHGGTSEIPVQLCEILFLVPARLQKQPGHVLIFHSALLLKGTQQIIQIIAVLLLCIAIQIAAAALPADDRRCCLHGRQGIRPGQPAFFFHPVIARPGQLTQ